MTKPCYIEIEGLGEAKAQFRNLAGGYTSVCEIDTGFVRVRGEATTPMIALQCALTELQKKIGRKRNKSCTFATENKRNK